MVIGVLHNGGVHRRKLPSIIHAQHHLRRLLGQLADMDVLEDIKNGESFGLILGGFLGLLRHCEVFGSRIDPRDAGRVVAMVPSAMSWLE